MKSGLLKTCLFCFLLITFTVSCERDEGPVIILPPKNVSGDTLVSFSNYIQPIFIQRCIMCHNEYHPFLNLIESFSYNQLLSAGFSAPYIDSIDPEASILMQRIRGITLEIMPPSPPSLSDSQRDSIKLWMLQGARNN